jgi:hypothetical protein
MLCGCDLLVAKLRKLVVNLACKKIAKAIERASCRGSVDDAMIALERD